MRPPLYSGPFNIPLLPPPPLSRSFTSRVGTLSLLDEEYCAGIAELYTNEPRQFHVRVPCRSRFNRSHVCSQPATIVFRVRGGVGVWLVPWGCGLAPSLSPYGVKGGDGLRLYVIVPQ